MGDEALSEHHLSRCAAAGDRAALQELLLSHHDELCQAVARAIPAAHRTVVNAEDVCQETYVSAFGRIEEFTWQGEGSFGAWLRTIAMRRLADALRVHGAAKRGGGRKGLVALTADGHSTLDVLALVAQHSRTPSRSAAGHEAADAVLAAVAELRPDHRTVIELLYFQGCPVSDVAERMGRTPGAVQMLSARAIRQLETLLGDPAALLSRFS